MPYKLAWLVEEQVLLIKALQTVSSEELMQQNKEIMDFLNASSKPNVYLIIDNSEADRLPNMFDFAKLEWPRHPKLSYSVVCGMPNRAFDFLTSLVAQLFKSSYGSAKTLDEAMQKIQAYDPSLADLSLWKVV